ncbi:Aspartate aminotransferase [Levilactobacillus zymae]|uniref:Aspartate aminotransferase n=1 Tax=Levilactobacillus zymae TaxID=267363 RepID=A0A1Y6JWG1_9LACO|nr:Aspartate aminotransferase [Levilactobacillus zymae]
MVNTILKEADLFCPNSVRINFPSLQFKCNTLATRPKRP